MNKGIVSTGSKEATHAGAEILRAGGNAFDAAISSVFTSMTSEFALTGVGGGGAMMCHQPGINPLIYDFFVDTPPYTGNEELDFFGVDVDFGDSIQTFHIGKGSAAVPGTLLGLITIHEQYGVLPLKIILEPAINLAREGSALSKEQAYVFKLLDPIFSHTKEGMKLFYLDGNLLSEGEKFNNVDFADFLERVSKEGAKFFYQGDGAKLVSNFFGDGGLLNENVLKEYHVALRKPIQTQFYGTQIFSNPAPSVGGTLIIFLLQILEKSNIKNVDFMHLLNALQLTNNARSEVCIDPNQEYLINNLLEEKTFSKYLTKYGNQLNECTDDLSSERGCTTHVSVIDKNLNSASVTTTNGEGCGYILPGTGVMLNNMLGEADLNPLGFHSWTHSMRLPTMVSPSIILKDHRPYILLGSGGSNRIRSALVQVIVNVLVKGMNIEEAINAPRIHLEGNNLLYEPGVEIDDKNILDTFTLHPFEDKNLFFGGVNAVTLNEGCSDPRRGGACEII